MPGGISGDLSRRAQAKLVHNAVLVELDGPGRHIELDGNFLHVESFRQQLQHLALARCQLIEWTPPGVGSRRKPMFHGFRDRFRHVDMPLRHVSELP